MGQNDASPDDRQDRQGSAFFITLSGTLTGFRLTEPSRPWKTAVFSRYGDAITMRAERFRYTRYKRDNYQGDRNHFPSKGSCELFDHQADPGENNNIAGKTEYAEHLRSVEAQFEAGWTGAVPAN
jgi:hypothetical protein